MVKSLQKEQNRANLLLWPPICRNKPAITPKWFNSLETKFVKQPFFNHGHNDYEWADFGVSAFNCQICITIFNYTFVRTQVNLCFYILSLFKLHSRNQIVSTKHLPLCSIIQTDAPAKLRVKRNLGRSDCKQKCQ